MCCDFFRANLFLEKLLLYTFSEWLLRHNSYIFGVAIFSEQLLFSSFFRRVTFSQQLFFQNSFLFRATILMSSHFLRIRSSLWQLLFGTAVFSLFRIKIYKKELFFQSRYFCTISTFLEKKEKIFKKSNIPYYLFFLESCFFKAAAFSKDDTFYSSIYYCSKLHHR